MKRGGEPVSLETVAKSGARNPALFFVGRRDEIAAVNEICAAAIAAAQTGGAEHGTTQLFQGAPGAGKSALLAELTRDWNERAIAAASTGGGMDALRDTPLPVNIIHTSILNSETETARTILKAVDPELEKSSRTTRTSGASGGFAGLGAKLGLKASDMVAPEGLTFANLASQLPAPRWPRPVVLTVDEIQDAAPEAGLVLNALHQNRAGLPVVPVLAGLGNSWDHLGEIAVSRPDRDAIHGIEALPDADVRNAVERMFADGGVSGPEDLRKA